MTRPPLSVFVVGLIAPVAITLATTIVALTWLSELPATIAVHWNGAGEADGFGSPVAFLLQLAVTSVILAVLFTGLALFSAKQGQGVSTQTKLLIVLSPFMAILLSTVTLASLGVQRGLAEGATAPNPVWMLAPGIILGLAGAGLGWLVLPKSRPADDTHATVPEATALTGTDRVLWTRSIGAPAPLVLVVSAVAVLIVVSMLVAPSPVVWPWLIAILGVFLLVGTLAWRVRIDGRGVVVRSALGLPRFRVRLAEIASASVPVVNPLVEFGGWGVRFGAGRRVGVILNGGDALEVHRTTGSSLVVTVPDAIAAASLINGLVARETARR